MHTQKKPPLIFIACPAYDKVWAETATCVINLTHSSFYNVIVSFFRGGLIHRSRNTLAKVFLEHEAKPDYLLFVDSDMLFKADALEQLLLNHKDIVTGNAFSRAYPCKPVVGTFDMERPGRVIHMLDYQKDALQPVDSCGMAFTLISRRALEQVGPRPFDFIFFPESDGELPEDSAFCWRAKQKGLQVWLDSRVQIGHIGDVVFDERDFEASKEDLIEKINQQQ
jgi:cellulose synthase/poly-beta-1,6-N-acetylglucosamine synthase-like glycosyltransferase